jgi:hypothetical protein
MLFQLQRFIRSNEAGKSSRIEFGDYFERGDRGLPQIKLRHSPEETEENHEY